MSDTSTQNPNEARMVVRSLEQSLPVKKQKNLTEVPKDYFTKKTSILFMLLPEWSKMVPPYNMARLIALVKANGYSASGIDLNIKAYRDYEKNWKNNIDFNPWDPARDWKWRDFYDTEIHHHMEPFLRTYLDKIGEINPTAIGFTLYYCNEGPTKWLVREIKKRYPHIIIIVGGPQGHNSDWNPIPEYDYIVSGEGELNLLEILNELETVGKSPTQKWLRQENKQRLDLSSLPNPDYDSFDFNEYEVPNGVNSELSRGCIAKCVYCLETHYWKYRDRTANSVLGEILELNKTRGTNFVYFIDSLVNGNLIELRNFAKGIVENNLKIKWVGYARSDKRMDLAYYKDLADSGCMFLNYGFESGSNKVLEDINKKCKREDIEQNLRDSSSVGIMSASNWIVGFPTETIQDLYETLVLAWRNRNCKFDSMSVNGYGLATDTIAGQNIEKFNVSPSWFGNNWITKDYTNSKVHRLVRMKNFNILIHIMNNFKFVTGQTIWGGREMSYSYTLTRNETSINEIEYEVFDFNIITPNISPFADALVNEIWPLFRVLWRALGSFSMEITFDPTKDYNEFGPWSCGNYTATYKFDIDKEGKWKADFYFKFIQDELTEWRDGADQSWANSVAASRARVLARENSDGTPTLTEDIIAENQRILEENKKYNFSFEKEFTLTSKWNR